MLALLFPLLQAVAPAPPVYSGAAHQSHMHIPRIEATVQIDGNLDEPVWKQAAVLDGFSQYRPVDGRPADDSTQVLAWYSGNAIYFGIRAFERHGNVVRATLADRDKIDADDNVQLLLDTFLEHRRALMFAVNPLGIQEDGIRSEGQDAGAAGGGGGATSNFDGTTDLNPDFVWQSRGRLTPWGYVVEVRIPFKSISFQSVTPQSWGLQIIRNVQHSGYEDTWTPAFRANASFLAQAGTLVGLTGMHRGLVMDLIPEFTTHVNGDSVGTGYGYSVHPEAGGTMRWGITSALTLSATAHPDFSQVEADVAQVTVNRRFALYYPEKRPFFLYGLDQYDTPNRLIYTRQIVQPAGGAKLAGTIGGTNVAYLGAVDERDTLTGRHPVYNLLRLRRDVGASSTVGLVYTDKVDGGDFNRVAGADARVLWGKLWFSQAQIARSWTHDSTGTNAGTLWDVVFADRTGRSYGNHFELQGFSPDFVAASGFVNRVGIVNAKAFNRWTWYGGPQALVEQVQTFLMITPIWRYDDFSHLRGALEGGYSNQWGLTLRGGWTVSTSLNDNMQRFDSSAYAGYAVAGTADTVPFARPRGLYNLVSGSVDVTSPNRPLTASVSLSYGASPIFAEAADGRETSTSMSLTWKPTDALRVYATWAHDRITRARDGTQFAVADIPRLEVDYQLRRAIFFRYIGQYVAQRQASLRDPRTGAPLVRYDSTIAGWSPLAASTSNTFRNDVLLSFKPVPGTVFFLGYGATLAEPQAFIFGRGLQRTTDGVFVKASYLFRM